jgi:hypothetical protein
MTGLLAGSARIASTEIERINEKSQASMKLFKTGSRSIRVASEIVSAQYSPHLPISVCLNSPGFEISRLSVRLTPRGATKKNPVGAVNSPQWL